MEISRRSMLGAGLASGTALAMTPMTSSPALAKPVRDDEPIIVVPEPAQATAVEGFVEVSGARLWYWDTKGSGDAVILLHPATGSGISWTYQQPVFAHAGYRVIGYSRREHFKSEIGRAESADGKPIPGSEDLKLLAQHLGVKKFHLVGCAAGAFIGADYMLSYPETLHSVVLASSVLGIQDPEFLQMLQVLIPQKFMLLPPEFRELGPSYRAANPRGTARWLEIEKTARTSPLPPMPTPEGRPEADKPAPSPASLVPAKNVITQEKLAALRTPLLLMTGDADLYMPPALLFKVAAKLPRAETAIIRNAGHATFWEQSVAFNRHVLDFVRRQRST